MVKINIQLGDQQSTYEIYFDQGDRINELFDRAPTKGKIRIVDRGNDGIDQNDIVQLVPDNSFNTSLSSANNSLRDGLNVSDQEIIDQLDQLVSSAKSEIPYLVTNISARSLERKLSGAEQNIRRAQPSQSWNIKYWKFGSRFQLIIRSPRLDLNLSTNQCKAENLNNYSKKFFPSIDQLINNINNNINSVTHFQKTNPCDIINLAILGFSFQ